MITRDQLTSPLGISIAAIILTVIVLAMQIPSLFGALLAPTGPDELRVDRIDESLAKHDEASAKAAQRFAGRSMFYDPPPYPIVRAPTQPPPMEPEKPVVPKVQPPPAKYAGPLMPKLLVGEDVWFSKGRDEFVTLQAGDEDAGVKLLRTEPPWSVLVAWSGGEYSVPILPDFSDAPDPMTAQPYERGRGLSGLMGSGMGGGHAVDEPSSPPTGGRDRPARPGRPAPAGTSRSPNR
jgi:hypothetical protein